MIVRMLNFWYTCSKQEMCIKWGQAMSEYFTISNGVRQGSTLSPRLFVVYVDDLSKQLIDARSGCFIEHQCINNVIYVDNICLLAPSALGLQKLLDVCSNFSQCNDIVYNFLKSVYIAFRPKRYNIFCPTKILQNKCVLFTYNLINNYECLVIVLSMSRWNCLEVIVHHYIVALCGLINEKLHNIEN